MNSSFLCPNSQLVSHVSVAPRKRSVHQSRELIVATSSQEEKTSIHPRASDGLHRSASLEAAPTRKNPPPSLTPANITKAASGFKRETPSAVQALNVKDLERERRGSPWPALERSSVT
ncbi:hypothetical protein PHYSODRAFT_301513 [Phytophthora sojae]|uniref:Uncharacterized protein n=1 Tax=Phytophthora sojae (strain P6497) TaxID=1094619 RepID=G4ZKS4_PHYSP|nr:hypothetical protein PHYSODRAFT_301513 [Phytophthora sojae]EGZ14520.1 hypothetical protein PHYSODRAFT_301513 [Phytophthora sojae]|eukprot:XP_009528269.1 hypothetical protein PHYSODRAFT_301513 [Phytophthora sojae]